MLRIVTSSGCSAHVDRALIPDSNHDSQWQGKEEIDASECVNASASDVPHASQVQGEEEINAAK
jgi:hypothetical protein